MDKHNSMHIFLCVTILLGHHTNNPAAAPVSLLTTAAIKTAEVKVGGALLTAGAKAAAGPTLLTLAKAAVVAAGGPAAAAGAIVIGGVGYYLCTDPSTTKIGNPEKSNPLSSPEHKDGALRLEPAPTEQTSNALAESTFPSPMPVAAPFLDQKTSENNEKDQYFLATFHCAVVKLGYVPPTQKTQNKTFKLPGKKIPLSHIRTVNGNALYLGANTLVAPNVTLPNLGEGNLVISLTTAPVVTAQHTQAIGTQPEPLIYPPYQKGHLLRLPNVAIPDIGISDLVMFIPEQTEKRLQSPARAALGGGSASAAQPQQPVAQGALPLLGAIPTFGVAGGATTGVLGLTGATAATIAAPIVIGGATIYGIVRFVKARKARKIEEQKMRDELARSQTTLVNQRPSGCGSTTPVSNSTQGCGNTKPYSEPKSTGFGDPHHTPDKPTGFGSTEPIKPTPLTGFGGTDPLRPDDLIVQRLLEEEVKAKWGGILKDIFADGKGLEVGQKRLDHLTSGHIEGGDRVFERTPPRSIFNSENELVDILVSTIKNGNSQLDQQGQVYIYDFGKEIGKTVEGKALSKVKVVVRDNASTGNKTFITMYPIE